MTIIKTTGAVVALAIVSVLGFAVPSFAHGGGDGYPTTTVTTTTTTTETQPTTPPSTGPSCPPGYGPYGGKDGDESDPYHNQSCCPDTNPQNERCDDQEEIWDQIHSARFALYNHVR